MVSTTDTTEDFHVKMSEFVQNCEMKKKEKKFMYCLDERMTRLKLTIWLTNKAYLIQINDLKSMTDDI